MKLDNDGLGKVLDRLRTAAEARAKARTKPRARTGPGVKVDIALLNNLKKAHPKLIHELAKRMDKSRHGIYWMLRHDYGVTEQSQEAIKKLNGILKEVHKELKDSLRNA